jgi:hypothetical protein
MEEGELQTVVAAEQEKEAESSSPPQWPQEEAGLTVGQNNLVADNHQEEVASSPCWVLEEAMAVVDLPAMGEVLQILLLLR